VLLLPPIKSPLFFPEKIPAIARNLPDILTSSLSLSVAQELAAGAPSTRQSAAVPDPLPRRRLLEMAEENHRRRPAPSPPVAAAPVSSPSAALLPVLSLAPVQ
jgi:hypothetical protein